MNSSLTPSESKAALDYVEELRLLVNASKEPEASLTRLLPPGLKGHVAGACFAISQEHHHGIVHLVTIGLNAPACALVRPTFEAYARGEWLARQPWKLSTSS